MEVIDRSYETNFPLGGGYRLEFTVGGELEARKQKDIESTVCNTTGVTAIARHR